MPYNFKPKADERPEKREDVLHLLGARLDQPAHPVPPVLLRLDPGVAVRDLGVDDAGGHALLELYNALANVVIFRQSGAQFAGAVALPVHRVRREATTKRSATDGSLSTFQVWWGLTIPAGQTLNLPSDQDWTGVTTVAIAVDCSASAKNAQIFVWWGMNIANFLTATDAILGSNFTFANMGGAMLPAYGSSLRLQFKNTGATDLSCDQVTAYGVNR